MLSSQRMSATPTVDPTAPIPQPNGTMNIAPRQRWWHWWPFVLAPIAFIICAVSYLNGRDLWMQKPLQEPIAIIITFGALIVALLRLGLQRNRFYLLFTLLAACVVLREFHFEWTTKFIYAAVAVLGVWAFFWRDTLIPFLDSNSHRRCWLIATAWTYVFSQIIARKGLQRLCPEGSGAEALLDAIYTDTEEVVENVAHLMLLITALIGPFRAGSASATDTDSA